MISTASSSDRRAKTSETIVKIKMVVVCRMSYHDLRSEP